MDSQFRRLGLSYERVQAIDGKLLTSAEIARHGQPQHSGWDWAPSEIACFLSHRLCWREIARGADEYVAVFEDDMHFLDEVQLLLANDAWIPAGAEIVKIEAATLDHLARNPPRKLRLHKKRPIWTGAGAYIISKRLASDLALIEEFRSGIDCFLFDPAEPGRTFDAFEIVPALCIQDYLLEESSSLLASTVESERSSKKQTLQQIAPTPHKLSLARKLLREIARPLKQAQQKISVLFRTLRSPVILLRR